MTTEVFGKLLNVNSALFDNERSLFTFDGLVVYFRVWRSGTGEPVLVGVIRRAVCAEWRTAGDSIYPIREECVDFAFFS